ncbi:MAG: GNAT family N-acetyltransferase [Bryobacterales bacterium]|nr:GNAT family N-acetyltransferase [Bryobacterales bacterium]
MRDFEIINENLRNALAAFSHVRYSGEVAEAPGVSLVHAGVNYSLFNTALLTEPVPGGPVSFKNVLDEAESFFGKRSAPWSLWFCDDLFTASERRRSRISMATRGLRLMMEAPGMIARQVSEPDRALPDDFDCYPVGDTRTRSGFSRIMAEAFQVPPGMADDVYAGERLWQGPLRGFIAYVDDEPVSTTGIVLGGDSIGVYAVATMPRMQRRGYGEALMRRALEQVRLETGITRSVLQSSAAGYQLYLRMGYRNMTRFSVYVKT